MARRAPASTVRSLTVESLRGEGRVAASALKTCLGDSEIRVGDDAIPFDELLFLRFARTAPLPRPRVQRGRVEFVLENGDRIVGRVERAGADDVEISSAAWGGKRIELNLDPVTTILSYDGLKRTERRDAFRTRQAAGDSDVLELATGQSVSGFLEKIETTGLRFASDALGEILYPFAKIRGLKLAALEPDESAKPKGVRAVVYLRNGGILSGKLAAIDAKSVRLATDSIGTVDLVTASITEIGFHGGRCRFLSDMTPSTVKENLGPLFVLKRPFRRDLSVTGSALKLGGKSYPKGLGVHAFSSLEFPLAGEFKRFQCTIGLDDSVSRRGKGAGSKVVFRVFGGKDKLFEKEIAPGQAPSQVDLKLPASTASLRLEVASTADEVAPVLARANWAQARVVR